MMHHGLFRESRTCFESRAASTLINAVVAAAFSRTARSGPGGGHHGTGAGSTSAIVSLAVTDILGASCLPGRIEESFPRQLAGVLRETPGLLHGGGRLRPKRVAVVSAATDRKPLPLSGNCSVAELMSLVIPHAQPLWGVHRTKDLPGFDPPAGSLTSVHNRSCWRRKRRRRTRYNGAFASEPALIGTEKYCRGGHDVAG
jgi:hypothetical protein